MEELIKIQSELRAPKDKRNSFGNYNYRSCESILESVKPLLLREQCILTLTDDVFVIGERYYVKATAKIVNKDGKEVSTTAFARESEQKKGMDDSQITGTASSYARKYALNGLFAIDDAKDADTDEYHKQTTAKPSDVKETALKAVSNAKSVTELQGLYSFYKSLRDDEDFLNACKARKEELK